MAMEKYFEVIDGCIRYVDDVKHPYTAYQIIDNSYNMVLTTGLYI